MILLPLERAIFQENGERMSCVVGMVGGKRLTYEGWLMANERKTESIVRRRLDKLGYFKSNRLVVEEQRSDSPRIDKLLKNASKKGGGRGYPEFIITSRDISDFLIVIECKADARKHRSDTLDRYAEYAVDGVLLYASFLSKEFDVLAIAVSGETKATLRISHYLHLKGTDKPVDLPASEILTFDNYYNMLLRGRVPRVGGNSGLARPSRSLIPIGCYAASR